VADAQTAAAALKAPDFSPIQLPIKGRTRFKVEQGTAQRLTLGAAARGKEQAKKASAKAAAGKKVR
jgi:hypothetical protein